MELFGLLALCLVAAVLSVIIGQYKKEYAVVISVATSVMVFVSVIGKITHPIAEIVNRLQTAGIEIDLFFVALKALALGYITQFVGDTCRDFGQSSLAAKAEFIGKISIFIISLPLANTLFDAVVSIVS